MFVAHIVDTCTLTSTPNAKPTCTFSQYVNGIVHRQRTCASNWFGVWLQCYGCIVLKQCKHWTWSPIVADVIVIVIAIGIICITCSTITTAATAGAAGAGANGHSVHLWLLFHTIPPHAVDSSTRAHTCLATIDASTTQSASLHSLQLYVLGFCMDREQK